MPHTFVVSGETGLLPSFVPTRILMPSLAISIEWLTYRYVHDTAFSDFKRRVQESILGPSRVGRAAQREVSIVIRAALLACGVSPFGERLERIAGALPRG